MSMLSLQQYQSAVHLFEPFIPQQDATHNIEVDDAETLVRELLHMLLAEEHAPKNVGIPQSYLEQRQLLRALLNIRPPYPLTKIFRMKIDTLLQLELQQKTIIHTEDLPTIAEQFPQASFQQGDKLALWQGDITQLDADAIVNAANSAMLGCFQPLHACIDNAIHSAAGPQLREDCEAIMSLQHKDEKTGHAKITRAYHLPASYVLHTVGPIVPNGTALTNLQKEQLASCYRSCLEVAHEVDSIGSIAFCAISTGVFGFPKNEAASTALHTVNEWLSTHDHHFERIIFNVFSDNDYEVYRQLLV